MPRSIRALTVLALATCAAPGFAQDDVTYPNLLDGTLGVEGDLIDDEVDRPGRFRFETVLGPWEDLKEDFRLSTGITFGGSLGILYQNYSDPLNGEENAAGYKLTLNFSRQILNVGQPDAMTFDLAVEERGPIKTDLPPLQGGIAAGNIVPTAATWGEFDLGITQAYVQQSLFDNSFQYAVGKLFAPNFVNAYPYFDDNRQFLNQNFSTSPTMASALRGFGAVALWFPTETGFYVQAGTYTANSEDTGTTVGSFFEDQEYFSHVDIGWSALARRGVPIQARGPMDPANISVTFWQKDAQENAPTPFNAPEMQGIAFNVNLPFGENGMWFLRGGMSDGWVTERALSGGFGIIPTGTSDLWGIGVGWTEPAPFISDRDQTVIEAFYRYQVTPNFALAPDIQLVLNPTINPAVDQQVVLSLRGRLTF
jgi:porin